MNKTAKAICFATVAVVLVAYLAPRDREVNAQFAASPRIERVSRSVQHGKTFTVPAVGSNVGATADGNGFMSR